MSDIEREIIKDENVLKLVLKHFKKINKIKKSKIDGFIQKRN